MLKRFSFQPLLMLTLCTFVLVSCGKKAAEPPQITELELSQDKSLNFGIKGPKNWKTSVKPGEMLAYYSSEKVMQRFIDYKDEDSDGGAKIEILAKKVSGTVNMDSIIQELKIFNDESLYKPLETVKIAGMDAKKLAYEVSFSDGSFKGERYFTMKDSTAVTIITFEAFGGTFDALKPKFDEMLGSVELAYFKPVVKDTVKGEPQVFKPSETLVVYGTADNFSIQIPDNFSGSKKGDGGIEFKGIGGPADCTIRIDVKDASKQNNLDKIVAQNKAQFGGSDPTSATLGGEKAFYFQRSVKGNGGDITSRTYFAVKNSKLYRVTLNWFKPEQEIFLPTFEKSLASFQYK